MKPILKSSIRVFCSPSELAIWINEMCSKWGLFCLYFKNLKDDGVIAINGDVPQDGFYAAYLFPKSHKITSTAWEDQHPRMNGCVTIRGGRVSKEDSIDMLALSEILAENFLEEPVHPVKIVKWLKQYLRSQKTVTFGVIGTNPVTGGSSTYKDIGFTLDALSLHQQGWQWKSAPNNRSVFEPAL